MLFSSEQDRANRGFLAGEFPQNFHAGHARHSEIEQQDIGLERLRKRNRLLAIGCFGNHLKVGLSYEETAQAIAENRVVIGNDKANWWAVIHRVTQYWRGRSQES
jgi:hypothetical protein